MAVESFEGVGEVKVYSTTTEIAESFNLDPSNSLKNRKKKRQSP
jgi:hypothetical protein